MTTSLRALLKKGTEIVWLSNHSEDFKHIIQELCSPKMLKYYESKKKFYLEVDASKRAIRMALLQSVQNDHKSEANDGIQESCVDIQPEKCIIPDDLLPVAYGSKTNRH